MHGVTWLSNNKQTRTMTSNPSPSELSLPVPSASVSPWSWRVSSFSLSWVTLSRPLDCFWSWWNHSSAGIGIERQSATKKCLPVIWVDVKSFFTMMEKNSTNLLVQYTWINIQDKCISFIQSQSKREENR